jgi:hypothetical protein
MMDEGASESMTRTYGNLKTYDCNIGGSIKETMSKLQNERKSIKQVWKMKGQRKLGINQDAQESANDLLKIRSSLKNTIEIIDSKLGGIF